MKKAEQEIDATPLEGEAEKKDGKLVVAEEISVGRVGWKACECTVRTGGEDLLNNMRGQSWCTLAVSRRQRGSRRTGRSISARWS